MTTATLDDLISLNDEIAALVRAGLPLEHGLAQLGGDMPGRLGRTAAALAEAAARGESLDQAIVDRAVDLPPVYRAVIQAGMKAGRLPAALEAVAGALRRITDARRAAVLAVSYPLMVSAVVWCGLAVFTALLAPRLAEAFQSLGVPGDRFFAALAQLGRWAWYWGPVGPVAVAVLVAVWWYLCNKASSGGKGDRHLLPERPGGCFAQKVPVPFSADWLLSRLPWMGRMLRWTQTAAFLDILALLVENKTPLDEAVTLAGDASGDWSMQQAARQLAQRLRNGQTSRDETACGFATNSPLPPLVNWLMLAAGRRARCCRPCNMRRPPITAAPGIRLIWCGCFCRRC